MYTNWFNLTASGHRVSMLSLTGSLFNHCCFPNCIMTTDPKSGVSRCLTNGLVESGNELCISYKPELSLFFPVHIRKVELKRIFGFECKCKYCKNPKNTRESLITEVPPLFANSRIKRH